MDPPLPAGRKLLELLDAHGVRFAHWKSNNHLAEGLAGKTDLDLLVHRKDAPAFRLVMAELPCKAMAGQPWASYPDVEDWLVFDSATGGFLHLHVHYELLTGLKRIKHLRLPWTDELLAGLRRDSASGWPIPPAEMELLILLVRIWAKMPPWRRLFSPRIPPHILAELRWLQGDADPAKLAALAHKLGLKADLEKSLADEAAILAVARHLNAQLIPHVRMPWSEALLRAGLLNVRRGVTRLWLRSIGPIRFGKTLPDGGAMVALIGSDGAGKSTLARDLEKWLRFKLDAHLLYMGSGDGAGGWVNATRRRLSAPWRGKAKAASRGNSTSGHASFAGKLWRLLDLHLMRRKLRLLRLGRKLADDGSVILLDRYPQSQVNAISDGPRQQEGRGFAWAARSERKLHAEAAALGPDLLIKLQIDPHTAHRRKPDHDMDVIARKCAIIEALRFAQSEMVTIDAAQPYPQVLLAAKIAIWSHLAKAARP